MKFNSFFVYMRYAGRAARLSGLAALLLLSGCVVVNGTRAPDGTLTIATKRFFWASEGIDFSLSESNRITTTLKVQKSSVDSAAINAVAAGVIQGVAAGAKTP